MKRLFSSIFEPSAAYDLPMEVPYMLFEHFDLKDFITVERVCKTWYQISVEHNVAWKRMAYQKNIPILLIKPIRIQVLSSFIHYCKAARIIFPEPLKAITCEGNPANESVLIDELLIEYRGSAVPKHSIIQHLANPENESRDNLEIKTNKAIARMNQETSTLIGMLQVALETNTEFDFKFFEHIKNSEFGFGSRIIINFFKKRHQDGNFARPFPASQSQLSLNYIKQMDTAIEAALPFVQYLFEHVNKPSLPFQIFFYTACSYSEIMKALIPIRIILHEKQDTLNSLLENLSGKEWIYAFETFMLSEKVDLDLKIKYPTQLQEMIKNWDEQNKKTFTDLMVLQTPHAYSQMNAYFLKRINNSIEKSLI